MTSIKLGIVNKTEQPKSMPAVQAIKFAIETIAQVTLDIQIFFFMKWLNNIITS
jgi:hypothetical protein